MIWTTLVELVLIGAGMYLFELFVALPEPYKQAVRVIVGLGTFILVILPFLRTLSHN